MKTKATRKILAGAVLVIVSSAAIPAPCYAQAISAGTIDGLTKEIMSKELDLLKLNSNLKLHQSPTPWTARRWGLFNLAGVALTATGAYMNGAGRFAYLHSGRIKKAPKYLFVDAGWCRVTANGIMVGGAVIETAALAYKDFRDKKQGVNLPVMRKYADDLQNEIDALISKRDALISSESAEPNLQAMYNAEGQVLRDVRDLGVNEFVRYYADTKSSRAFFYSSYLIAGASNFLAGAGGIVGNYAQLTKRKSTARWRTRLGGTGGIADIIAGAMNQSVPVAVRVAAHVAGSRAKNKLCKQLDCKEPVQLDKLHADQERFHQLVSSRDLGVHGVILKDNVFAKTTSIFDEHEKLRLGDEKAKKRRLISQSIFFTGIGAPKLVNGIGTTVGAFKYTNKPHERFEAIGGPALAYGAGYSVAMAELIRSQISNERRAAKAKREGTSAGQILKREIGELEQLSSSLKTEEAPVLRSSVPESTL